MPVNPDLNWCSRVSADKGIATRCPFASVYRCPRYYQSLSLMGCAGSTAIDKTTDDRLKAKWERTDLWPVTSEQSTAVMGKPGRYSFLRFCPEVAYDQFRLFAENLLSHGDEIDRANAEQLLGPDSADWEYNWSSLTERHYSDCSLYSLLKESDKRLDDALDLDDIIELKPGVCGISLNVKAMVTRFCIWWLRRLRRTTKR